MIHQPEEEAKYKEIVSQAFTKIAKGNTTINFAPVWVANNTKEGGLGLRNFHLSEKVLPRRKLIGVEPATREDFINFYTFILHNTSDLHSFDRFQACMDYVQQFVSEFGPKCIQRVQALCTFFDIVDTNKDGLLSKNELTKFYENMVVRDYRVNDDFLNKEFAHETAISFRWIDRNNDGFVTLSELVSCTLYPTFLKLSQESWLAKMKEEGINIEATPL